MQEMPSRPEKTGEILRQLRLTSGLSLKEVGRILGVSYQQVQKYESGINRIPLTTLPDLCDLFGVSAEVFIGGSRTREVDDDVVAVNLAMQAIPSKDLRRKIRQVVEILAA